MPSQCGYHLLWKRWYWILYERLSSSISLEYVGGRSKENQNIIEDISASSFIAMINMLNTWAKEEKQETEFKLQIEF